MHTRKASAWARISPPRNVEQHVNFDKYLFGPELLRDTAPGSVTSFDLGNPIARNALNSQFVERKRNRADGLRICNIHDRQPGGHEAEPDIEGSQIA